jgi:hypothetical protein
MAKAKKAQVGISATPSLRKGQYKRLGRISDKNPERAERVANRMIERDTRLERGKAFVKGLTSKMQAGGVVKKAQAGKSVSKKEAPKMNFKSSDNWADNYSLDTTGLSKGSSNYYPYKRSNGTKGVVTKGEAKKLVDEVKSGKLKKSEWFKSGGKLSKKK